MNAILTKYLKDFSVPETPAPAGSFDDLGGGGLDFPGFDDVPAEPEIDVEALVEQARREGYDQAREELEARHETEIATLMSVHAGELEDLRNALHGQITGLVEARLAVAGEELVSRMAAAMTALLVPLVEESLRERVLSDLVRAVAEALEAHPVATVILRGPADLCEPLRGRLEERSIPCQAIEADTLDVTVEMGDSVIVSRLTAWRDGLAEVLAEGAR